MDKATKISIGIGFIVGIIPGFFGIYFYNLAWWLIVLPIIFISAYLREEYQLDNTLLTRIKKFKKKYFYDKNN